MVKQTTKKSNVKKTAVKPNPVMEHQCGCGHDCPCGCHKHGAMHAVKHIIVWAIIFALGMACGKMMNCNHGKKFKMPRQMQPVFTNGCLDVTSIKCPQMQEEVVAADVNADNCISIEEYKTWKKANKQNMRNDKPRMNDGKGAMRDGKGHMRDGKTGFKKAK